MSKKKPIQPTLDELNRWSELMRAESIKLDRRIARQRATKRKKATK